MSREASANQRSFSQKLVGALNSPLFIAFFTLAVVGGTAGLYNQSRDDLHDQTARRAVMGKLLTEYQHRVSELGTADSALDEQLGPSGTFDHIRRLAPTDHAGSARWEKLSDHVSEKEWAILTGSNPYVPTAPDFSGVSFISIASQIDNAAGIPDLQFGALRMIGILDAAPPATWVFVRSQLPTLTRLGAGRNLLYINQTLPLRRGQVLNAQQERQLGIPQPKPGELERLERENGALSKRVLDKLENASAR